MRELVPGDVGFKPLPARMNEGSIELRKSLENPQGGRFAFVSTLVLDDLPNIEPGAPADSRNVHTKMLYAGSEAMPMHVVETIAMQLMQQAADLQKMVREHKAKAGQQKRNG